MTEVADLSPTDASNTSITSKSLNGNVANMANMDDTLQAMLGMLGRWTSSDTIASAATTDIGAQAESYLTVSGTTTITAFGTVRAGTVRFLRFSGALTLTHNATSLILPGASNIVTAAGDTAVVVSEGSGNWRMVSYVCQPNILTRWVAYTPTFTGVGTVANLKCRSRRNGPNLEVEVSWQNGTVTGVDFSMTLGFNGANGSGTCAAYWDGYRPLLGPAIWNVSGDATLCVLGLGSSNLVNIGLAATGRDSFTPVTGTVLGTGVTFGARFSVPIEGWN